MLSLKNLKRIVGEHIFNLTVSDIVNHSELMENLVDHFLPTSTFLIKTCTGCNCICWKEGVIGFCIPYNTCMICYQDNCIRSTKDYKYKCSN